MANVFAVHSVGNSLMTYLKNAYPASLSAEIPFDFKLMSTGELAEGTDPRNTLSLLLFRVTQNEHLRGRTIASDPPRANPPLSIDLHYLLTAWADNALFEHTVLTWAMREIQMHPVLDSSALSPEADWGSADMVQLIPAELSAEELFRLWELLEPKYHLSVSYIARVIRVDTDLASGKPVVAARLGYTEVTS
jgi:hypothetical protein